MFEPKYTGDRSGTFFALYTVLAAIGIASVPGYAALDTYADAHATYHPSDLPAESTALPSRDPVLQSMRVPNSLVGQAVCGRIEKPYWTDADPKRVLISEASKFTIVNCIK